MNNNIGVAPNNPSLKLNCSEVRELLNKDISSLSIAQRLAIASHCAICSQCGDIAGAELLRKLEKAGDD